MLNVRRPGTLALLTVGAMIGSFLTDPDLWLDRVDARLPVWMLDTHPGSRFASHSGCHTVEQVFALEHSDAVEMAAVLADLTPPDFELEVDLAGNRLIARGHPQVMVHVDALVEQLDVPLEVLMTSWAGPRR